MTYLGAVSLVLNATEWKRMFGLVEDPQLTVEQSQMAVHSRVPEGAGSLMDCMKCDVKSVYLRRETVFLL